MRRWLVIAVLVIAGCSSTPEAPPPSRPIPPREFEYEPQWLYLRQRLCDEIKGTWQRTEDSGWQWHCDATPKTP